MRDRYLFLRVSFVTRYIFDCSAKWSNLHAENYIAKVDGETAQKVIKIVKQ